MNREQLIEEDLDALELRAMRFHKLNPLHECFDSTTVLALIGELRQERARMEVVRDLAGARRKTIVVYMRENAEWELRVNLAEAALSRAEETIEKARAAWWSATEQGDNGLVYTDRIEGAMDEIWNAIGHADYDGDKQKEN